jgi:hypothetical protein
MRDSSVMGEWATKVTFRCCIQSYYALLCQRAIIGFRSMLSMDGALGTGRRWVCFGSGKRRGLNQLNHPTPTRPFVHPFILHLQLRSHSQSLVHTPEPVCIRFHSTMR